MFFFNLTTLEKISDNNPVIFMDVLKSFYYKKLPSYRKPLKYSNKEMVGSSFLINPEPLFKSKVDVLYIIQYVKLAARRDYTLYKFYNYKALNLSYFPDIKLNSIKTNPLLKITETEIFFYFEEVQKGKSKWH